MLYLSDIINAVVHDQTDEKVGVVLDIVLKAEVGQNHPPVYGLVVKDKKQEEKKFVRTQDVESFAKRHVTIKKYLPEVVKEVPEGKDMIFLKEMVLDRQIVDLEGIRVVRVNDLQLGYIKDVMSLIAIDIGQAGLFRRLGVASKMGKKELVEWKDVRLLGDKIQLSTSVKDLTKLHPADVANLIEKMNLNQGSMLLETMDQNLAARVLEEIEPEIQKILVEKLGTERASSVMQKMSVDELVDLIQILPERESREILEELPSDTKKQHVKKILEYDEDTAGGLMTTEYLTAYPEDTAKQVIETIRRINHMHNSIYFIYVIDRADKFSGVVSLRRLMLAEDGLKMEELMKKGSKIPTAKVDDELLEIASLTTKYNLFSVAVLDDHGRLLGIVTVDDIMRHFVPHA
ncbi:MAG: CBS domain-containing protein [bacterium]